MKVNFYHWLLLISMSSALASLEPELPPCPTHFQYLPQDLPMHCKLEHSRTPRSPQFPGMPPYVVKLPPGVSTLPPDKMPLPIPYPPFPPAGMPAMPMPMPPMPIPPHKLPVIVMPFYSQDGTLKKKAPSHRHHRPRLPRRPNIEDTSSSSSEDTSDTDTDTSSSVSTSNDRGWWTTKKKKQKKKDIYRRTNQSKSKKKVALQSLLTPVLQYVTKDGYVIFEKKITKNEAKDWLSTQNDVVKVETTKTQPSKADYLNARMGSKGGISKFKAVDDDDEEAGRKRPKKTVAVAKHSKVSTRDRGAAKSK